MIKWTGHDTAKVWNRTVEAENMKQLLETLIEKGIINGYWDPEGQTFHELAYVSEIVSELEDRYNDDEDITEKLDNLDWDEEVFSKLTDQQFEQVIRGCDSQAYYQQFEVIE